MTIIVATDENQAIGNNNQLLWHLPDDLKRFKSLTTNHTIIMGRKTFESLGRPLPNRINIIISSEANYAVPNSCILCNSLEKAIEIAKKRDSNPFIIGGGKIYKQSMNLVNTIELTLVHTKIEKADTYFPTLNLPEWNKVFEEFHPKDEKHIYDFTFLTYIKK